MPHRILSRRTMLRGTAGALIALPLLEAMGDAGAATRELANGRRGTAGGDLQPLRFLTTYIPGGMSHATWWPTEVTSETQFELSPALAPLAPVREHMIVLRGLNLTVVENGDAFDGHREGSMAVLTGSRVDAVQNWRIDNDSLDLHLAQQIGASSAIPSLTLGAVGGWANHGSISHYAAGGGPDRIQQPADLFTQIFGNPDLDASQIQALTLRRQSVLDRVRGDYESLVPKISGADRQRIDAHLEAIRTVEMSLVNQVDCGEGPDPATLAALDDSNLNPWFDSMKQLVVLALQCDATRVISLTFRNGGGGASYFPWLGLAGGDAEYAYREHHETSHFTDDFVEYAAGESRGGNFARILEWHLTKLAELVQALAEAPDGIDGTLLDRMLVLNTSEHSQNHGKNDMPFLLFGRGGGAIQPGRYLQYGGIPHNRLLVSVMNAMGVAGDSFGEPSLNDGPLPNLAG